MNRIKFDDIRDIIDKSHEFSSKDREFLKGRLTKPGKHDITEVDLHNSLRALARDDKDNIRPHHVQRLQNKFKEHFNPSPEAPEELDHAA